MSKLLRTGLFVNTSRVGVSYFQLGDFEISTTKTDILIFRDDKNLSARKRYFAFLVYLKVIWN